MPTILTEAKRVKVGNSLTQYKTTANGSVATLTTIKQQLLDLKAQVEADADFLPEDVAEIDATIAELAAAVAGILS